MWPAFFALGCARPEDPDQVADIRASALAFLLEDADWNGLQTACINLLDEPPGSDELCEPTAGETEATLDLLRSRNYLVDPDEACGRLDTGICRAPVDAETGEAALRVGAGCPLAQGQNGVRVYVYSSAWTCDVTTADPYVGLVWSLDGWEVE